MAQHQAVPFRFLIYAELAGAEIKSIYNIRGRITPEPQPQPRDSDGHWTGGSAGQWAEEMTSAVVEHGADGFFYREELEHTSGEALRRWAEEVVPAVREAVAKA